MSYSLLTLQVVNILFGIATLGTYLFAINLWHDQAVVLFSVAGSVFAAITIVVLALGLMTGPPMGWKRAAHLLWALLMFLMQLLFLTFALWQKVAGSDLPFERFFR